MNKHTPGPWATAEGSTYCAIRTDARVIADMRLMGFHYNKADAALIAAAPDLIASVDAFLDIMDAMIADGIELSDNEAAARAQGLAVIARVRGES